MTRAMYRHSRPTRFTRLLSVVLILAFTLSMTGVVHASDPAEETKDVAASEAPAAPAEESAPAEEKAEEEAPSPTSEDEAPVAESEPDELELDSTSEDGKEPAPSEKSGEVPAASSAEDADKDETDAKEDSEDGKDNEADADKDEKDGKDEKPDEEPPHDAGGYTHYDGNPRVGDDCLKIDSPSSGSYTFKLNGTTAHVDVTVTETDDGEVLSWSSDVPVDKVIVKGGPAANIYAYSGATSGSGLHAPIRPSNKWADISWVAFCFTDGGGGEPEDEGRVCVYKFNDLNGDGDQDEGEGPLSGWVFHIEETGASATTDDDGYAAFEDVPYGHYTVHEMQREGWEVTTGSYLQTIHVDSPTTYVTFGNKEVVEEVTHNKTFELVIDGSVANAVGGYGVAYKVNGVAHEEELASLGDGTWAFETELLHGSVVSEWQFFAMVGQDKVALTSLGGSEELTHDMINRETFTPGVIDVNKFIDTDGDGSPAVDTDDALGSYWGVSIEGPGLPTVEAETDEFGHARFAGLLPGTYQVREEMREGYRLVSPAEQPVTVMLALGDMQGSASFVNAPLAANVLVEKTVTPSEAMPGDQVTWTITITNNGDVPLTAVYLVDELLLIDDSLGPLAPGASHVVTVPWTVPPVAYPEIVNTADVIATHALGTVTGSATAVLDVIGPTVMKSFRLETVASLLPAPDRIEADYTIDGQTTTVTLTDQGGGVWLSDQQEIEWGSIIQSWSVWAVVDGVRLTTPLFSSSDPEALVPIGAAPSVVNTATYSPGTIVGSKSIDGDRDGIGDMVPDDSFGAWTFTLGDNVATAQVGADGSFSFEGVLPGTYEVEESMTAEQETLFDVVSEGGASEEVVVTPEQDSYTLETFVNQPTASGIEIMKTASAERVLAGDDVIYTITVRNTGAWRLDPVTVTDEMLPEVAEVIIPALEPAGSAGDSFTFTVTHTVPEDELPNTMVNKAVAVGRDVFGNEVRDEASAAVEVEAFAPFTEDEEEDDFAPFTEDDDFLPFTGGELLGLLLLAGLSLGVGTTLRRSGRT